MPGLNQPFDQMAGQEPQQPKKGGMDPMFARLAALIPLALAKGGREGVAGLLRGYQRSMAAQQQTEMQQGQIDFSQQQALAQGRRATADDTRADAQLKLQQDQFAATDRERQRRQFLEQAQALGAIDQTPEAAMTALSQLTPQASALGVPQAMVESQFAVTPTGAEKRKLERILAGVDKTYKDVDPAERDKLKPVDAGGRTVGEIRAALSGVQGGPALTAKNKPTPGSFEDFRTADQPTRQAILADRKAYNQSDDRARAGAGGGGTSGATSDMDRIADAVAAGRRKLSEFTPTTRLEIAANMERRGLKEAPSAYAAERTLRTRNAVDSLLGKVSEWTTGYGSILANLPRTQARAFRAQLDTLKSAIAFNELTEMRAASRTGGALGQVSDREMTLLSSALGALDTAQEPGEVKAQLEQILASLDRWDAARKQEAGPSPGPHPPTTRGDASRQRVLPAGRMKVGRFDVEIEP